MKTFAQKLKEARGDRRPEEAAVAIGVSMQTILNWEAGRSEPTSGRLQKLANFYGVPITYFFEAEKKRKSA